MLVLRTAYKGFGPHHPVIITTGLDLLHFTLFKFLCIYLSLRKDKFGRGSFFVEVSQYTTNCRLLDHTKIARFFGYWIAVGGVCL